ncbi:MAG: histidine ammonia-lyase [Planctomycetes bacterium]|nr:histidine ammonia-lyase [Planctomycetota bacterium]
MLTVGRHLSIEDALEGARAPTRLRWDPAARRRATTSAARVARAVARSERVYGITTGFGSNAVHGIDRADAEALQRNLLVSHAFGAGDRFPDEVVRLALLLRIHALARGHSGIRPSTVEALVALYEHDVLAVVPSQGSVGASGDLSPLSFLALPLLGVGRVRVRGRETDAARALARAGLSPVTLAHKEGLALVNGTQVTLACALLAWSRARTALLAADVAAAMSTEALAGRAAALDPRVHVARGHPGQIASAARIRAVVAGSRLVDAPPASIPGKRTAPQDAYGLRCAPQVHGAAADGLDYAGAVLAREVDAATDNPLVFGEDVLSGGNFHAEPVALAADHTKLCVHELGSISERRTASLVDAHMNEGLPPYLAPTPALHSGFMLPQYVAAALVSENKVLCHPASADSIPTGANVEDHVSMGTIAARNAMRVADHVHAVLAIELMAACQAVELRRLRPGPRSAAVLALVRSAVPFRRVDAPWGDALERVRALVADGRVAAAAGIGGEGRPRRGRGGRR